MLEKTQRPLDSYPKRFRFPLPAWLRKNLPGAVSWPDRWLPVGEGAASKLERLSFEPARELAAITSCPAAWPWPPPLVA